MEKSLGITKPLYSDQILPVTWPFVTSKLHCRRIMAQYIQSVLIPPGHLSGFSHLGNLSENLCPEVGHLSILLEEVNIVHFSIFQLKIRLFQPWKFLLTLS